MAGRWKVSDRLRTAAGTVAAIGAGVLLAPVAGLGGCASGTGSTGGAGPATASYQEGGTGAHPAAAPITVKDLRVNVVPGILPG